MNETPVPTLLLADDNVDALKMLRILLQDQRKEFICVETYTVDDTVAALQERHFDAMLLDLQFIGENFEQTLARISKIPNLPPVVVLTGRDMHELSTVWALLDPYACLHKPADVETVSAALRAAIFVRRKTQQENAT